MDNIILNWERAVSKNYIELIDKIISDLSSKTVTSIDADNDKIRLSVDGGKYCITLGAWSMVTVTTRDDEDKIQLLRIEPSSASVGLLSAIRKKYLLIKYTEEEVKIKKTLQAIS